MRSLSKLRDVPAALAMTVAAVLAATPVHAQRSFNLGFEEQSLAAADQPAGWWIRTQGFRGARDTLVVHSGKASLRIENVGSKTFATVPRTIPVELLRGHTLDLSVWVRTDSVNRGWAGYWVRVDGPNRSTLGFDNMQWHGAHGTSDWTRYSATVKVPEQALDVYFGPILSGDGTAWFDDVSLLVDGKPLELSAAPPWQPTAAELAWTRRAAIPFASARAGSGFDDLRRLDGIIGEARIVSLGEGTHGTSEFFQMKHRLTEYLATKHGFTVFAIEANMPEARAVNEYVLTGKGNPRQALSGLYFWTWDTQEVLDMIEWMRQYNASGKGRIEFWGFDMQTPTVALDSVRAYVARVDAGYLPAVDSARATISQAVGAARGGGAQAQASLRQWQVAAASVLKHLEARGVGTGPDSLDAAWAIQNARVVLQGAEGMLMGGGVASRDSSMAANVGWILRHHPAGTRIVLWAHNGHVQRGGSAYVSMGQYLSRAYGARMRVLGFALGGGEYTAIGGQGLGFYPAAPPRPGSYESVFRALALPRFVLDLRPAATVPEAAWLKGPHDFRVIGAMAVDDGFSSADLASLFDAVIYFDSTTHSKSLRLPATLPGKAAPRDTLPHRVPPGWKAGNPELTYHRLDLDTTVFHGGHGSGHIVSRNFEDPRGGASLAQKLRGEQYAGKRVRLSAWIKARRVNGSAEIYMRANGKDQALDDAWIPRPITGTSDWTRYEVVLDVPKAADELLVRVGLQGPGEIWFDDVALETVGAEVSAMNSGHPVQGMTSPAIKAWWGPIPSTLQNPGLEPD